VADDDCTGLARVVNKIDYVADEMENGISIDCRRLIGLSVASLIGCDSMKSRSGKRRQLVAPRVPTLREAMQQNY
jgi:hypothetical protein